MIEEERTWRTIVEHARSHFTSGGPSDAIAMYASGVADGLVTASPDLAGRLVAHLTGLAHEPQEWWRGHLRKALLVELVRRPPEGAEPDPDLEAFRALQPLSRRALAKGLRQLIRPADPEG